VNDKPIDELIECHLSCVSLRERIRSNQAEAARRPQHPGGAQEEVGDKVGAAAHPAG
jgi:hypothetical protein